MKVSVCGLVTALSAISLTGCFTIDETEYPSVRLSPLAADATNCTVTVRGFEATVTETLLVTGYETVYVPGGYGRRHYHPGGYELVRTTAEIPQSRRTDVFLERAKNLMEESGFNIMANPADYIVEARFSGPFTESNEDAMRLLWWVGTVFTCDSYGQGWRAKLKIYDNRTGKLVFTHDYDQRYEATMFSPVPLFGIASYDRTDTEYIKRWCLTALTDRMAADATAFLSAKK